MLTQSAYRYWNGSAWVATESSAVAIVAGPVSELSVRYDSFSAKWLMMYLQGEDIILRTATGPAGPWGAPQIAASSCRLPGPLRRLPPSVETRAATIYFAMSQWNPYNVYLMKIADQHRRADRQAQPDGRPELRTRRAQRQPAPSGFWACRGNCGIDNATLGHTRVTATATPATTSGWHDVAPDGAGRRRHQLPADRVPADTSPNSDNGFFGAHTTAGRRVARRGALHRGRAVDAVRRNFNSGPRTAVVVFGGVWTDHGDIWIQLDDFSLIRRLTARHAPPRRCAGAGCSYLIAGDPHAVDDEALEDQHEQRSSAARRACEPAMSRPHSLPRSSRKLPRNCMIWVRSGSVMVRIGHT